MTRRPTRIAIGGIRYESNSFAGFAAPADCFTSHAVRRGHEVAEHAEPNSEIAGALACAADDGCAELIGTLDTFGGCGAPVPHEVYCALRDELLDRIARAGAIDAVYLPMHGAMTTTECDDAEADLLRHLRAAVGDRVPVIVSFDLHAAVSAETSSVADAVIGFKTCPHVDYVDTGHRAMRLAIEAGRGEAAPRVHRTSVAMLTAAEAHDTNTGPLARHMNQLQDEVFRSALVDGSIFACQPWLDTARSTWTITITYRADLPGGEQTAAAAAAASAARLAADLSSFEVSKTAVERIWDEVGSFGPGTVLVADSGDSPSAGAPGDSVDCLRALHGSDRPSVLATVTDPVAARQAWTAGPGAVLRLSAGGRLTPGLTAHLDFEGTVLGVSDGRYVQRYPAAPVDVGPCALVRTANTDLVITSRPAFMLDMSLMTHLAIDPARYRVVQVKSAGGFRALWSELSTAVVVADSLGASTSRLTALPFTRLPPRVWPFTVSAPTQGVPA